MQRLLGALLACAASVVCAADRPRYCGTAHWEPLIAEAAERFAIPPAWVREVMRAESAGCTEVDGRPVVSRAGAMGLMQLMPATYAELRERHGLGTDPHAPRDNVFAGAAYLRELHDRFGTPGFLAAYHAGPARYDAHRRRSGPLPLETQAYLAQVHAALGFARPSEVEPRRSTHAAKPQTDHLFAIDRRAAAQPSQSMTPLPSTTLFVPIRRREIVTGSADAVSPERPRADR